MVVVKNKSGFLAGNSTLFSCKFCDKAALSSSCKPRIEDMGSDLNPFIIYEFQLGTFPLF